LELNRVAPITALNPDLEFRTLEGIEECVQMLAKSQGFKLHVAKHKNKSICEYYCGKIDCCYKEPNCPKKNKGTCKFLATFCRFGTEFKYTKFNLELNNTKISIAA
jgi:hypothetical protein